MLQGRARDPVQFKTKQLYLVLLIVAVVPTCSADDDLHIVGQGGSRGASLPPGMSASISGGHQSAIYALAFSEDGWLATGSKDRSLAIWNLTARGSASQVELFRRIEGHRAGITSVAFAPRPPASGVHASSYVLLSGGADNTTRVWDIHSGKELRSLEHPRTVFGIAVRPSTGVGLCDVEGRCPGEITGEVATACWDGVVRIFDYWTGATKATLTGHEGGLYSVAYSPLDGSLLASASADRTVRVWDLRNNELLWTLRGAKDHVTSVDWSPEEPFMLATGGWDRRFRIWRISQQEVDACRTERRCSTSLTPHTVKKHPQLMWRVAFAPGGGLVAACHGAVGQNPTVVIYDVLTLAVVRRLGRHKDTPLVIGWSPDGSKLASAGMDRRVHVYHSASHMDDMPQGDLDTPEEKTAWHEDLREYAAPENATSENVTEGPEPWSPPHPLAGRTAII